MQFDESAFQRGAEGEWAKAQLEDPTLKRAMASVDGVARGLASLLGRLRDEEHLPVTRGDLADAIEWLCRQQESLSKVHVRLLQLGLSVYFDETYARLDRIAATLAELRPPQGADEGQESNT